MLYIDLRDKEPKKGQQGLITCIGIMVGTLIGVLTDNIGLWLSLGLFMGAAIGYTKKKF
jgi:hypothetical protein